MSLVNSHVEREKDDQSQMKGGCVSSLHQAFISEMGSCPKSQAMPIQMYRFGRAEGGGR